MVAEHQTVTHLQVSPEMQALSTHRPQLEVQSGNRLQAHLQPGIYPQMVFAEKAQATLVQGPNLVAAVLLLASVEPAMNTVVRVVNPALGCVRLLLQGAYQA